MCKVALHTIANDRGEDFAEDLNQRQRPMIRQAAISATFVNRMHQAMCQARGVICVNCIILASSTAHSTQQSGNAAYKSGPLPENPGALPLAIFPSLRRMMATVISLGAPESSCMLAKSDERTVAPVRPLTGDCRSMSSSWEQLGNCMMPSSVSSPFTARARHLRPAAPLRNKSAVSSTRVRSIAASRLTCSVVGTEVDPRVSRP